MSETDKVREENFEEFWKHYGEKLAIINEAGNELIDDVAACVNCGHLLEVRKRLKSRLVEYMPDIKIKASELRDHFNKVTTHIVLGFACDGKLVSSDPSTPGSYICKYVMNVRVFCLK